MVIPVEHTKGEYWGGSQLTYTMYKVSAILFGFVALDHLLLRSPTTAFIKVFGKPKGFFSSFTTQKVDI